MAAALHGPVVNTAIWMQSAGYLNHDVALNSHLFKGSFFKGKQRPSNSFSKLCYSSTFSSCIRSIRCNSSIFSDGINTSEDFDENDEDFVNCTILEAVEVKSSADGFMIKMRDGRYIKCEHNHAVGVHLPDYSPQPAIVLRMEDDTKLLLPIIVLELPCTMLMEAVRNVKAARPTIYNVMKDMIELMGYQAKLVRVTKRVHEAYFARLYLSKEEDGVEKVCSLDVRPSDGINLAVRCKIPVQVNKELAQGDGVRIVQEPVRMPFMSRLDTASSETCAASEEFVLVRSMMVAAFEERYSDAARLRDQLSKLRAERKRQQEA